MTGYKILPRGAVDAMFSAAAGAGQIEGECPECGYVGPLHVDGYIAPHLERRMGRDKDGRLGIYEKPGVWCDGEGQKPVPADLEDVAA